MSRCSRLALAVLMLILAGGCAVRQPLLQGMSEEQFRSMAGQLVMVGFRGLEPDPDAQIVRDIREGRVGGVILFSRDVALKSPVRNVQSPEQVRRLTDYLQSQSDTLLLVAVDQEGGRVARFTPEHGFPPTQSAKALGQLSPEATRQAAQGIGETLRRAGCNLDMAPVVDVDVNPDNPAIGRLERSFSPSPQEVARHGLAFVRGLHDEGVLSCLKHFPGHGSAWNDSHHGLADVTGAWSELELEPYAEIFASGEADTVMTAHVFNAELDPEHPATLSRAVIQGLLRQRLGFDGVVMTDDMQMKAVTSFYGLERAVTLAMNAGVDMLLFGNNLEYDPALPEKISDLLLEKVANGEIPLERIRQAHRRVVQLKRKLAGLQLEARE